MHLDYLRLLYGYNAWANTRILDTAEQLTPEQLRTSGVASFGSIHDTLVHAMSAQWNWLQRWRGREAKYLATGAEYPDLAAVRRRWDEVEGETEAFVASLGEDDPARIVTYTNQREQTFSFPLWKLMLHAANHGTQHRSEVAAMLTAFGHSPGGMDLLLYFNPAQDERR